MVESLFSEEIRMSQVLLVDDEKNVLKSLSIGLKRYKYSVSQARSGLEALRIMKENPCDIVVTDIRMFPMDGYTFAARVRKKYPWVSIVLMSAYGFDKEQSDSEKRLVCHRLTKPFPISELVRVLRGEGKKKRS